MVAWVAWVRRVRTGSGATAVQIAESVGGRRRIVAHVGSARTEAELGLLLERARAMLPDGGQEALDLGVTPMAVKGDLIPSRSEETLFADGEASGGETGGAGRPRSLVAAARVVATGSGL